MIPTTDRSASEMATLRGLCSIVANDLARVEKILSDELRSRYPYVDEMLRYGNMLGGKRLRPILLLLSAQATGSICREHHILAAVVEMIHTATLVHDDVLDEAEFRRHLPTVNSRWDDKASILLGDFLFSHAFYLASTTGKAEACEMIGRSTNIVCEGEMRQKGHEGDFAIREADYFAVIEAKTAELCACSCRLGSYFAQSDSAVTDQLTMYGRDLGLAFQIADDVLDVDGDETIVGKSLGTDLHQLKPTLPLIRLMQTANEPDRLQIEHILNHEREQVQALLLPLFARYGVLEYARERAASLALQARRRIERLPSSDAQVVLGKICDFVVSRTH